MKITVKVGLLFAAIWITVKMILYSTGAIGYDVKIPVLFNILCILLAISIGLFKLKRSQKEATSLLTDIKNGLTAGVPYAIIVSVFLYVFYEKIDTNFIPHRVAEVTYEMKKRLDDPQELKRLKAENEDFEVMTKEQIYERMIQGPVNTINSKSTMILALLALLMLATLNSIFVAVIYRKVVFK